MPDLTDAISKVLVVQSSLSKNLATPPDLPSSGFTASPNRVSAGTSNLTANSPSNSTLYASTVAATASPTNPMTSQPISRARSGLMTSTPSSPRSNSSDPSSVAGPTAVLS